VEQANCRSYVPRAPAATALHWAVRTGLPDFLAQAEALGGVPRFILKELNAFRRCGDLSQGFVRVECPSCKVEVRVGFSCKGRTVCPSCSARRAALTAAHLVDEVLPRVPIRQWTLAFPKALKLVLAMDPALMSAALRSLVSAIFALQRRRARQLGIERPRPGAVAFLQAFSSALLLHPHHHVLVPDGVFHGANHAFAALPPPDDEECEKLLRKVAKRVWKLARARYPDGLPYAEDAQAALSVASVQTRLPLGDEEPQRRRRCAFLEGFSLHADTWVHQNDRDNLEKLCRYGARGPLALERLSRRDDGKLEYRLKKPLRDGTTTLVMTPVQLLKRLVALVVKPKVHLTRFFGVFAPNSRARASVVPQRPAPLPAPPAPPTESTPRNSSPPPPPRLDWAGLLRRTWGFDVFQCPCGARRRVIALITSPELARRILGLPPFSLPSPPPTGPPQLSLPLP
jgi:hypothetical protein